MPLKGNNKPVNILVSRVDAMGDVILALPLCGILKKYYPDCKIIFLGRTYTKSIVNACIHIDKFMDRDDWNSMTQDEISSSLHAQNIDTVLHLLPDKEVIKTCWQAKIKTRIGGINKIFYWRYCNKLVPFSRKKSRLSEAQLNIKLLRALKIKEIPTRTEIPAYYGFSRIPALESKFKELLVPDKFNLVIHPLSNKNAKEWGLHNFSELLKLAEDKKYRIFITGSEKEKPILADWINSHKDVVHDLTGALNTDQLIAFIAAADGLIASSTGPVHIAAAAGINTLGLYENRWIKRGERWGPIGIKAGFLECVNDDMDTISAEMVYEKINNWKVDRNLI